MQNARPYHADNFPYERAASYFRRIRGVCLFNLNCIRGGFYISVQIWWDLSCVCASIGLGLFVKNATTVLRRLQVMVMTLVLFRSGTAPRRVLIRFGTSIPTALRTSFNVSLLRHFSGQSMSNCIPLTRYRPRDLNILCVKGKFTRTLALLYGQMFSRRFERNVIVSTRDRQLGLLFAGIRNFCFASVAIGLTLNSLRGNFHFIVRFYTGVSSHVIVSFIRVWCYVSVRIIRA